ncbi:MAG: UxaA family hydrolase, partial [Planctomycetota bacterium]
MTTHGSSLRGFVHLDPADNVAIATAQLSRGTELSVADVTTRLRSDVSRGHKIALSSISDGSPIVKYGQPIGLATTNIQAGDHVHTHNVVDHHVISNDLSQATPAESPQPLKRSFDGFHRPNGTVGTRNYVAILSTVNCSASVCHKVVERFDAERLKRWPNVDGVFAATHTSGCAMQYHGIKHQMLGRVLAGYSNHSNVGGCVIIGLGCEQTTSGYLTDHHGLTSL